MCRGHLSGGEARITFGSMIRAATGLIALALLTALTASPPAGAAFPGKNGRIGCSGHLASGPYPTVQTPPGFGPSLEVFLMDADGSGTQRLTNNSVTDFSPKFSPDGKRIAFQREDLHLWTMNVDGTNQTQLTSLGTSTPGSWSPDGSQIVFQTNRDGNFEVYKMNADGSNQVNLTNNATPGANIDQFPSWSPDGKKIAFRSNRTGAQQDIYMMNPDGSGVTNLTAPSLAEESYPQWSPDGRQIVFHSDRDAFGIGRTLNRNLEVYRMSADGSGVTRLTFNDYTGGGGGVIGGTPGADLTGYDMFPAWSPAGDRIVFQSGRAQEFRDTGQGGIVAQWEVYTVDAVKGEGIGGDLRRLTNRAGNDERCDWQPIPTTAVTPPPRVPIYPPPPAPFVDCPSTTANVIRGTVAADRINGTAAADRIFAGTGNDTVDGLAGDDCIDLGPGTDSGQGGAGADLIVGGLGADRLSGSAGNDRLRGGASGDRLIGGLGNDRLHGQSGSDRVNGERGVDRINGGSSNDVISAGSSGDRVAGDQGQDRISGNSGNDSLSGNSGNDRLTGGAGADRLSGGSGNDRLSARDGRRDRVACGRGRDSVVADRVDTVSRDCEAVRRR